MLLNQKFSFLLASVSCLAAVNAAPQFINFDAIITSDAPTPTAIPIAVTSASAVVNTVSAVAAASSAAAVQSSVPSVVVANTDTAAVQKRAASTTCSATPAGAGPAITPDTFDAFVGSDLLTPSYNNLTTPPNYSQIQGDQNKSIGSKGWYSLSTLSAYDSSLCAAKCDSLERCEGFNLYFERDPSVNVDPNNCPNPASTTNIKCVLLGSRFQSSDFINGGGWQSQFHVGVAGSVGFLKNSKSGSAPTYNNFQLGSLSDEQCTINAPSLVQGNSTVNTFIQSAWFSSDNIDQCAATCQAHTSYTLAHDPVGKQSPCNYFTAYQVYKNGAFSQTLCGLYTHDWSASSSPSSKPNICSNSGSTSGSDVYTITQSYDYAATVQH